MCLPCPEGRYTGDVNNVNCSFCDIGTYQDTPGQKACKACPNGKTTLTGHSASVTECGCAEGSYFSAETSTCLPAPDGRECAFDSTYFDCTCQKGTRAVMNSDTCRQCEDYLSCDGGHTMNASMNGKAGFDYTVMVQEEYMTLPDDPYSVYKCINVRTCTGLRSPHSAAGEDRICEDDLDITPRCGRCATGRYGTPADGCKACGANDKAMFYFKAAATFCFKVGMVFYMYKRFNRPNPAGAIIVASTISFTQSVQTYGKLPLDWPQILKGVFGVLDIVFSVQGFLNFLQFKAECFTGNDYVNGLIKEALSPLTVFLDFAVIYVIARAIRRTLRFEFVHNVIGLVFTRLFITIIRLSLLLFYRVHMPNGKVMVHLVPELEFLSPEWVRVLPISLAATVVYGGTTVAYVTYLVLVAPYKVSVDPNFMVKARFCFGSFRPDRHWWILMQLAYGFTANLSQVVTPASNVHSKLYMALFFLIILLVLEFRAAPFKFAENNIVDWLFNTTLIGWLIVATSFVDHSSLNQSELDYWNQLYAMLAVLMFGFVLAWAMFRFISWLWRNAQHRGVLEGHRSHSAWTFRDCSVAMLLISDKEFMRRVSSLGDYDLLMLQDATNTIISVFFGSHVHRSRLAQRLIPGESFKVWNYQEMQLQAWEQIVSGKFRNHISNSYRARAWLVRMALAAEEQRESIDWQSESSGPSPSGTATQSMGVAKLRASASSAAESVRAPMTLHVEHLIRVLGVGSKPIDKETFRHRVDRAFFELKIPADDVDHAFEIIDIHCKGVITKPDFVLVMHALVPEWMLGTGIDTMVSDVDAESAMRKKGRLVTPPVLRRRMTIEESERVKGVLSSLAAGPYSSEDKNNTGETLVPEDLADQDTQAEMSEANGTMPQGPEAMREARMVEDEIEGRDRSRATLMSL